MSFGSIIVTLVLTVLCGGALYLVLSRDNRQRADGLKDAVIQALDPSNPEKLRFAKLVEHHGVTPRRAREVARDVYSQFLRKALGDGMVSEMEAKKLSWLSSVLQMPADDVASVDQDLRQRYYADELEKSVLEGEIDEDTAARVGAMRERLGLSMAAVRGVMEPWIPWLERRFTEVVERGDLSKNDQRVLANIARCMGYDVPEMLEMVRPVSLAVYRERFMEFRQDGRFDPEELAELDRISRFCGLMDQELAKYKAEIERCQELAAIRDGQLPRQHSNKLLEGGELCHWESPCTVQVQKMRSRQGQQFQVTQSFHGEITVSSSRIIFTSDVKSFEFRPEKIVDVSVHGNGIQVQTSGGNGTGAYLVDNPERFEAVILGLARRRKFTSSGEFSSTRSRHIPDTVKREVWARDGGECVRCRATDYLEFDHVIPHSKGGANTVNNIQLLCRKCNQIKSDRV